MKKALSGLFFLLVSTGIHGAGLLGFSPTPEEMASLPDYCKANSAGPRSPEYQAWVTRLGPQYERTWGGMHHVCSGINQINRYQRLINDPKRGFYLSRAVPEINYVAAKMPDGFPLAGDILTHRGIANRLMRKNAQAMGDFMRALSLDPKQTPAYINLADIYIESGDKKKALELVIRGLKTAPTSKAMQKRYLALGGKEPFPKPDTPNPMEAEQEKIPNTATDPSNSAVTQPKEIAAAQGMQTEKETGKSGVNEVNKPAPDGMKPAQETKKNPYCRFCP